MPALEAISVDGIRLWFNSDDHMPPHFHASRPGEWEIRVYFTSSFDELDYDVRWQVKRPRRKALNDILASVQEARVELFEEWEEKVRVKETY